MRKNGKKTLRENAPRCSRWQIPLLAVENVVGFWVTSSKPIDRHFATKNPLHVWKVWASIKILVRKFGFTPPPPKKGPKWGKTVQISIKSSKLTLFRGGGDAVLWTKRFYGHLGVSELHVWLTQNRNSITENFWDCSHVTKCLPIIL